MSTISLFAKSIAVAAASLMLAVPMAQASAEKPRVALVMKSLANEFFLTMENGAKAHQKKNSDKYELITNGVKDESDTAGQIKLVEQMIISNVDAIVIAPADSKALVAVSKRAIDAGIVVINIDNQFDASALKEKGITVPFVGPLDRKGAEQVGDYLAKFLKPGDKVAIIEGLPTANNAKLRTAGFQDAMKKAGAKVVGVQTGEWEIDKANKVAAAMLSENPDMKALLCGNDSMAIGAVAAVKSAGLTGKVRVVGFDNISAVAPMLKDGRMTATAEQHADKLAIYGIENALKFLKAKAPIKTLGGVVETPVDLVAGSKK
ncbi:ribose transport system substrate-binding protein [Janthinobacterium sp. CG_23.3]|uniref:sugar ABC transporter substrate-binding protein n=1 Tax=unclassified Janthinobacterium TaxID=2610881 RepID=UPI00034AD4D0|nr:MULTISPECIES: sugar ABC transporter substrate-binding protein [unclassified Janthinobacterium]MEC5162091.1 ribose transport system substrate-binding protein [Janthinobacterium sp. CG_S6]